MARRRDTFVHAASADPMRSWRIFIVIALVRSLLPAGTFAQAATTPSPTTAIAQFNGSVIQLPAKLPASRQSGLRISVDPRWANTYGYRPVEVTISSLGPMKVDRAITVYLRAGWARV